MQVTPKAFCVQRAKGHVVQAVLQRGYKLYPLSYPSLGNF